jgi:predicted RNA-binding Zn-ribbon protein involved in translation (DUF1610 family)
METHHRCGKCGTYNTADALKCRVCGHLIHKDESELRKCPDCGFEKNLANSEKCIGCGRNLTATKAAVRDIQGSKPEECEHWTEKPTHAVRTAKVGMAGILILLGGALGVTHGLLALLPETGADILSHYESIIPPGEVLDSVMNDYQLLSGAIVIFGLLAVAMSMFAFTRTRFAGAIAGAAFGILSVGFLFGAFFAIVGLILLISSKREFLSECD